MSSSLNNSLSFDVPIGDTPPKTRTPLRPRTPFRNIGTTEDLNKKLESASERRKQALEETKSRNNEYVTRVLTTAEKEKKRHEEKISVLRESMEMDLAMKSKRRDQILEAKVDSAKKRLEKVEKILRNRDSLKNNDDSRHDDHSNKENDDHSEIEILSEYCHDKADLVTHSLKIASDTNENNIQEQ